MSEAMYLRRLDWHIEVGKGKFGVGLNSTIWEENYKYLAWPE